ncbi:hypothetical protein RB653_008450 [Dictyostelium firmibasis]|uniref:Uncharacterized protein n=1 Tax=Dictyostelium firmibasis TaxID=79012 RepID=A0AAN7TR32_9MYCE
MKILVFIIILFLFNYINGFNLPTGYGIGFVDPNAKCLNYIGDSNDQPLCNNRFQNKGDKIYTTINSQIESQLNIIKSFQSITFLQDQCKDLLFAQFGICDIYLAPCIETLPMITPLKNISLPQRFCKSACVRMVSNCPRLAIEMDCSNPLLFPEIGTFYDLSPYGFTQNNGTYAVPCSDPTNFFNQVASNSSFIEICPSPLLLKNSSDPRYESKRGYTYLPPSNCVLNCPVPNYSKQKWDQLLTMSKILSTISFILSLYNVLTFGIINKKISDPHKCTCFFSGSIALVNLCDIITFGIGYEELLCPEPGRSAKQQYDPVCGLTGALFHLGITYCVLWSMTMGLVLYTSVKRQKWFKFNHFLIGNTTFTMISVIIAAATSKFEAGLGSIECWIRDRWYAICLFWIPCGIALLIGSLCIISVIHEIYKTSKKSISNRNDLLSRELKPLLIVFFISGSFLYLFIFFFDIERNFGGYRSDVEDYVLCLLNGDNQECFTTGPSYVPYFLFYLVIRWFGIIFFIFYGTSNVARKIWNQTFILKKFYSSLKTSPLSSPKNSDSQKHNDSKTNINNTILNENNDKYLKENKAIELESIKTN